MGKVVIEEIRFDDGEKMKRFQVKGFGDLDISILDYGLTMETLRYKGVNRVLSLKDPKAYRNNKHYVGATIGRVAGRLSKALIKIDGRGYPLDKNEGKQCLHGGTMGFSNRTWKYLGSCKLEEGKESEKLRLDFALFSPEGEGGFPGNLEVRASFSIDKKGLLRIEYFAKSDQKTPVTFTNHSYFNLNTEKGKTIENHDLKIHSKEYLQLNHWKLPKTFRWVKKSPFDFQEKKNLGIRLHQLNKQGYDGIDHPFIFTKDDRVLELICAPCKTALRIHSTEPCVVVYTGNQLQDDVEFEKGVMGRRYLGICLETQWFPNAINTDFLPDNFLLPNEVYYSKTDYKFMDFD